MIQGRKLPIVSAVVAFTILASCHVALNHKGLAREESLAIERQVREQLQPGMTREETMEIVQDHFWRHYDCRFYRVDVYLVGSRDPDLAGILYLKFEGDDQTEVLAQVFSYENYKLDDFSMCEVFEK